MSTVTPAENPVITLDAASHRYYAGLVEYASVSSVIRAVFPVKKSWDAVSPEIIENARLRGIKTEEFINSYIRGESITVPSDSDLGIETRENDTVINGVEAFIGWWEKQDDDTQTVEIQRILHDDAHLIAGTADLVTSDVLGIKPSVVWDIKCVAQLEKEYALQIGSYGHMHGGSPALRIIHIHKSIKGGIRIVPYDTLDCIRRWLNLIAFYEDCKPFLTETP